MKDRTLRPGTRSSLHAMYLQLRELFFHANELLLGRQKAFQGLAVLVVAGTMAEGAGIALIMPLMVAIQGGEVVLPHWLGPLSQVELTNPAATLAGLVAAAFVVKNGLAFIRLRWSLLLSFGLWQKWVRLAVDNIIYAPVDPGDKRKPGVLVSTILVETKHSARVLLNVLDLLVSFFTFVCIYAVLFLASWRVTLALTVLITLIVVTGLRPLTRASHESGVRAVRSMGTTSNFLLEILGGISYLKAFGREDYFAAQMGEASDGCGKAFIKSRWLANFVGPLIETIFVLLFCSAIVVSSRGGGGVLATYLPLIGLFSAAAFRLFPVLSGVGREWVLIISNQPSVCRVAEQIRARPRESMGVRPFRELSTSIVFRGVGYEYPDRPPALVDLSVDLARGSRTVLVGESGSGKTTAVALLLGFLRPSTGDIVVDGINLRDLELNTWRRGIGFVGQEGFIFHTTIAENISLGRIPEDDSRIEEVCQVVGLRQFISTVPHGYATLVGERGTQLSGGQRQRIALARAILMRPEILILDEAMSALDNESAVSVLQAVNDYLPESTWLVVAHRLSGIEILDPTIVVLRHGRVLEKGRHGELMERRGYYCQLFEAEAAAPVPVERPIDPVGR